MSFRNILVFIFVFLFPLNLLFAQLTLLERGAYEEYMGNNPQFYQYNNDLRKKLLNDNEFTGKLSQCTRSLFIIKAFKFVKNKPLRDGTLYIKDLLGSDYLLKVFPDYETVKNDFEWPLQVDNNNYNKYKDENVFPGIPNEATIELSYFPKRKLLSSSEAFEAIKIEYGDAYSEFINQSLQRIKEFDKLHHIEDNENDVIKDADNHFKELLELTYQMNIQHDLVDRMDKENYSAENDMVSCDRMILNKLEEYKNKENEENLTTGILGTWKWFTGDELVFTQGGQVMKAGVKVAYWRVLNEAEKKYEVSWPDLYYKPIDNLTLKNNDTYLEGTNQYNNTVTATKVK